MSDGRRDVFLGASFVLLGLLVIYYATTHLELGSASRMGSGYFPALIGGFLALMGGVLTVSGALTNQCADANEAPLAWRALFLVGLSPAILGLLIEKFGLLPAGFITAFIAASAYRGGKLKGLLALATTLTALAALIFKFALGLQIELIDRDLLALMSR